MTQRLHRGDPSSRTARGRAPRGRGARQPSSLPVPPPRYVAVEDEPTILGFPAEPSTEDGVPSPADSPGAPAPPALVVARRADPLAATPLVLAGVAANVSLMLSWSPGVDPTGLVLVQQGVEALRSGSGGLEGTVWQPPVVVLGGGLLVLLGFLMLVPAHTHRLVGVLALVVALAAAAAVVVLIGSSGLVDDRFGPGMWCAAAVPVLGVLGALKAMLTAPVVSLAPAGRRRVS